MREEVTEMQRAIPQRRMTIALLAIVAAVATAPFAGATGSASASHAAKHYYLCPPVC